MSQQADQDRRQQDSLRRFHVLLGWWSLLIFVTLGIALEALHGLKIDWYLSVGSQTRRLMFTLAHAHGTLLSLIHMAFGFSCALLSAQGGSHPLRSASVYLTSALLLMPSGFFLGGFFIYGGDPGLGIFLVPVGGLMLFLGVFSTAWKLTFGGNNA